jgi:hypothetical protein
MESVGCLDDYDWMDEYAIYQRPSGNRCEIAGRWLRTGRVSNVRLSITVRNVPTTAVSGMDGYAVLNDSGIWRP